MSRLSFLDRHPHAGRPLRKAARFLQQLAQDAGLLTEGEVGPPPPAEAMTPSAAPSPAARPLLSKGFTINHVGMAVPNIDKFLEGNQVLYKNFERSSEYINERQKVRELFITDGKHTVELLEPIGDGSPLASFVKKNRAGGLVHICFECDDIKEAIASVTGAGGLLITGPIPDIAFDERPIAFLMLADQVIELVQRPAA
jgi:methylmalonyl-CoA/ethylmalonyl-CoA epimerase